MAENNVQEQQEQQEEDMANAINKTKEISTNAAKVAIKKVGMAIVNALTTLITTLLPYIAIIVACLALISGIAYILEILTAEDTTNNIYEAMEIMENGGDIADIILIKSDDKGYHLEFIDDFDERLENAITKLNKENKSIELKDKETLKKFIMAEAMTKYPDLGGESDGDSKFQGTVKIKRVTPDKNIGQVEEAGQKEINLKYVEKETFDSYVQNNDDEALNVFTFDENKNIITATWSYSSENGNSSVSIEENSPMDYRTATSAYTMPFEYPLFFFIDSDDEDFCIKLAELAMNSSMEITIVDNVTTTKTVTSIHTLREKTEEKYTIDEDGNENYDSTSTSNITDQTDTTELIAENTSSSIILTNINSWAAKKSSKISNTTSSSESTDEKVDGPTITLNRQPFGGSDDDRYYVTIDQTITTTVTNEVYTNGFDVTESEVEDNTQQFVDLYTEHKDKMKNALLPDWLFEIMENNEKTVNMVELTKYLLYKATGKDYGVTEFSDLELLDESYGIIDGGTSGLSGAEGKVYDFLMSKGMSAIGAAGVMGNIAQESGFNTGAISYDGAGSIGLCQWTGGRRTNLQNYAKSKGMSETDLQAQMEFLWKELTEGYPSLIKRMNNATSPSAAAVDFCDTFERPSVPNYPNRKAKAEQYYKAYKNNNINGSSNNKCTFNINLYKEDRSVDQNKINQLKREEDKIINNYRSYTFFNNNGLNYLQCTWWANARASTYLSKYGTKYKSYPTNWGNGGDYWQNNINGGWFNYGQTPKANSLLGYAASSTMGGWGHITYVEAVDPVNKKIYISHCSSGERWNGIYELPWSGALWGQKPQGYIYLDEPK